MKMKIAIQGIESSFHHLAVNKMLNTDQVDLIKCNSFENVATKLNDFSSEYAVIAIENTITGTILPNYKLIDVNNFKIIGEVYLNIQLHLMGLEGESIHDIKEVYSHPIALLQCKEYLRKFPPQFKVVEGKDTAFEAKKIKTQNLRGVAAIAGAQVAQEFGLKILDSNIQNMKNNMTRFVLLSRNQDVIPKNANKASLKFELRHESGSLSNTLKLFSLFNINLTKIQSIPIIDKPWQYSFFVDVLFENYTLLTELLKVLETELQELKVLGVYTHNKENKPNEIINKEQFENEKQ